MNQKWPEKFAFEIYWPLVLFTVQFQNKHWNIISFLQKLLKKHIPSQYLNFIDLTFSFVWSLNLWCTRIVCKIGTFLLVVEWEVFCLFIIHNFLQSHLKILVSLQLHCMRYFLISCQHKQQQSAFIFLTNPCCLVGNHFYTCEYFWSNKIVVKKK